jgi:hypothetical protein
MEFLSIQAYNCQKKKNAKQQRYKAPHTPPPIEKAAIQTLRTHRKQDKTKEFLSAPPK